MVQPSFAALAAIVGVLAHTAAAAPADKRAAGCSFPNPSASTNVRLSTARTIKAGETFDGKNLRYGRGEICATDVSTGPENSVFILESGATLSNAVIGADHKRAIECRGPCTIRNVWFENVCDQAVVLRQSSGASLISGGGVKRSPDVVVQHNGGGSVKIESYCAQDFGKLYKSCTNCATQVKREVQVSNVIARNGKLLVGVNSNYGDVATIDTATNSYTSLTSVCDTFRGTSSSSSEALRLTQNQSNAK
ncbi:unnamed protein product [Rhizoctonia solani]|uniref:Pectate lyase n=1 Tax=Rhizoctonia solani TaxID=456999 RepID=A0A8H3A8B5_9AGAM|nr:unnamed protein product [Rhizoctonia solani]